MQYVIGSMKEFDFPSNNVFIDEGLSNNKYYKIKDNPSFFAPANKALRSQLFERIKVRSFVNINNEKLNRKMIKRLSLHYNLINIKNRLSQYPQLSFFMPLNLFKYIDNKESLLDFQNLFVFSKNMTSSEEKELRGLGIENFDHLNEDDIQITVAYSLRNLYNKMKEDGIDNEDELIDVLSLKFGIKRPVLRKIFNNEIHPSQEIKGGKIKDGSSFNEAEIEFLHKAFFPTLIKDEETLQDYVENKNDCYNYLNNLLINRTLMVYNKEIVLKEVAKYITKNGEN